MPTILNAWWEDGLYYLQYLAYGVIGIVTSDSEFSARTEFYHIKMSYLYNE